MLCRSANPLTRLLVSPFKLDDKLRFASMLTLAIALHLLLLLPMHAHFKVIKTPKAKATMLEATLNLESNQKVPDLALNIARENHFSTQDLSQQETQLLPNRAEDPMAITLKPRKRTVSAAAHQSRDAAYLARWQAYVEDYGNKHYPKALLKSQLSGDLRLLVAVKKDGSLHEVSLRQSSGSQLLDEAAIQIVLQAAPYEPLPPEIAQDIEIFEIIRTWQFRGKLSTFG